MLSDTEFASEIEKLKEFFGKKLDGFQRNIWFDRLKHLQFSAFRQGVADCIASERYFPTIAIFLEKAARSSEMLETIQKKSSPTLILVSRASPRDSRYVLDCKEIFKKTCLKAWKDTEQQCEALYEMADKYPTMPLWKRLAEEKFAQFKAEESQRILNSQKLLESSPKENPQPS